MHKVANNVALYTLEEIMWKLLLVVLTLTVLVGCKTTPKPGDELLDPMGTMFDLDEAIIGGGILGTALLFIIDGRVAWGYLFTYPIFTFILHLYLHKKRAKRTEEPPEETSR